MDWSSTRAPEAGLDLWKGRREEWLAGRKAIDHLAMPRAWRAQRTVVRDVRTQRITDHLPVLATIELPWEKASVVKDERITCPKKGGNR